MTKTRKLKLPKDEVHLRTILRILLRFPKTVEKKLTVEEMQDIAIKRGLLTRIR